MEIATIAKRAVYMGRMEILATVLVIDISLMLKGWHLQSELES